MNKVFEKYLSTVGQRYSGCSIIEETTQEFILNNEVIIFNVTVFLSKNDEKIRFYENGDKGFIVKKNKISNNIITIHKKNLLEFGVISDLVGFNNLYLQNITEAFLYENVFEKLPFLIEHLKEAFASNYSFHKVNQLMATLGVNFENLFAFAYEANGNVFLLDNKGELYLYAMDHNYTNLKQVEGYPPYTLYTIEELHTINDFITIFFRSFML